MRTFLVLIIVIFSDQYCYAQKPIDSTEIRNTILRVMDRQVSGWNNGSIETFMEGYERSDSLRFASGGTVTYGWKTMLERYKKSYSSRAKMGRLEFANISVTIISKTAAVAFGTWILHRESDAPTGLFTLLFRKRSDTWRIVHDHTSSADEKK